MKGFLRNHRAFAALLVVQLFAHNFPEKNRALLRGLETLFGVQLVRILVELGIDGDATLSVSIERNENVVVRKHGLVILCLYGYLLGGYAHQVTLGG